MPGTAIPCSQEQAVTYFRERRKCRKSLAYFICTYCYILSDNGEGGEWVPFTLWPAQHRVARTLQQKRLVIILKARQLERRPRGQDRMGRHDAALCHSGLAPKR
jgi:hypothetical protein